MLFPLQVLVLLTKKKKRKIMHLMSLGWHLEGWGMSTCNYMLRLVITDLSPYRLVKLQVFKGRRPARTINISNNTADLFYFIAVFYLV